MSFLKFTLTVLCLGAFLMFAPVMADSMGECESVIREGNEAKAYKHCLAAAQEGNPKAQILVGMALMNGVGVSKNTDSAAGWFKRSADKIIQLVCITCRWLRLQVWVPHKMRLAVWL